MTGRTPGSRLTRRGEPIVYSVTVPRSAPNPAGGIAFVAFLLGPEGRRILSRAGQPPIVPPRASGPDPLPPLLARLVRPVTPSPPPGRTAAPMRGRLRTAAPMRGRLRTAAPMRGRLRTAADPSSHAR